MGESNNFPSKDLLVWIDLEMTGLDPVENKIIEIATIVTDGQLNIIAEGPNPTVTGGKDAEVPATRDRHNILAAHRGHL